MTRTTKAAAKKRIRKPTPAAARKAAIKQAFEAAKEIAKPALKSAKDIKAPKPGSKREIGLKLLAREQGATLDDLQGATGWARGACSAFMGYDVHNQLGYGYRKDNETGAYHLVLPKGLKAPRFIRYTA